MLLSFIVGVEKRSYATQGGNFGGDFPKRELAGGAQPRPAIVLATTSTALLVERLYGRCFVILHIEDGVELRDL